MDKTTEDIREFVFSITMKVVDMKSEELCSASLDRIDSTQGYDVDNVQWVDKRINFMKQDMTDEEFIELCCAVADYQRSKFND